MAILTGRVLSTLATIRTMLVILTSVLVVVSGSRKGYGGARVAACINS